MEAGGGKASFAWSQVFILKYRKNINLNRLGPRTKTFAGGCDSAVAKMG
jgi:hypothetical protein